MKISVIMPVYNEKQTILEIVDRVLAVPLEKELIIVDDGSTDGTLDLIKNEVANKDGVRVFYHDRNQGKGAAIRTAQEHLEGDITIIQDADLEYDPSEFEHLVKPIETGRAEVVYGSRFLGSHRAFLFWHMLGNKMLTLLSNLLYNTILTDMETCYKAFRTDVFQKIRIREDRFEFEPEITAKVFKMKCKVFEVPITYSGRDFHEGKKITWKDGFGAIWAIIKYRFVD